MRPLYLKTKLIEINIESADLERTIELLRALDVLEGGLKILARTCTRQPRLRDAFAICLFARARLRQ